MPLNKRTAKAAFTAGCLSATLAWAQSSDLVLEEIIVTAQKRVQSVQDVPIAISTVTSQMMDDQNLYSVLDLPRAVPSFTVARGYNLANSVPILIRGIGTLATQPAFEGSVGTYVDSVYRSRPGMVLSSMLDIGRVEILRGPQGTLFGKNTTAGAVTLFSNQPQDEFAYGGEVTLGDYDRQRYVGYVTGGLTESLTARLALLSDSRDGFTEAVFDHDDYGDLDAQGAKLSFSWEAADALNVAFIGDYARSKEVCCFGNPVPLNRSMSLSAGELTDFYRQAAQANFDTDVDLINLNPDDRENQNNVEPENDNTDWGGALDISYELSFASLRSITGYRDWEYRSKGDFDFGPVDIGGLLEDYEVETYSQEFNLTGTLEDNGLVQSIDYVAGVFFARENYQQLRTFDAGVDQGGIWELFWPAQAGLPEPVLRDLLGGGDWAQPGVVIGDVLHELVTENYAGFIHVEAALADAWSLILGVRYTDEEKTLDRSNLINSDVAAYSNYLQEFALGGYLLGANIAGPDLDDLTYSDSEWTYDVKLQYFLSDSAQLYGGYSRGFKSGGIGMDPEAGGGQPSGQNSDLLLELAGIGNGTGFADLEDPTYDPEYIDTWEVGLKTDYLGGRGRVNVAAFYNDIEDNQFAVFSGTGFRVLNASTAEVSGVEVENFFAVSESLILNAAVTWLDTKYGDDIPEPAPPGRDLTLAPEWAAAVNLNYDYPLSFGPVALFNANWAYRDDHFVAYDIQDKQDAYSLWSFQLGVRDVDQRWDVRLWCENCFDQTYATGYFNQPFYFDNNFGQYQGQFQGSPRTYGGTLRFNF
ncbi:MAG: TonB-dependent receptor [Pseudomonadota bacterium]